MKRPSYLSKARIHRKPIRRGLLQCPIWRSRLYQFILYRYLVLRNDGVVFETIDVTPTP